MAINLQSYLERISSLGMAQLPTQQEANQNLNTDTSVSEKDSYIPSVNNAEAAIPSSNYGADGMMVDLSQAFRANADSIQMTMDRLGLSLEDLADEENMSTLATAMNDGAVALGVPTVENMSDVAANLVQKARGGSEVSATTETAAVEENQGASTENGASGSSGSSSSEDETTVEVVVINGIRYLETTRIENGVEIKTRKVLDAGEV